MNTDEVLDQIDDAIDDWATGPDAMRCNAPAGTVVAPRLPRLGTVTIDITPDLTAFIRGMERAMRQVAEVFNSSLGPSLAKFRKVLEQLDHDEHHPPPLCIDGHAYRHRTRRRNRRTR